MDVRSHRGGKETMSPDRAKICRMKQKVKPIRKVQVVYYLSRNGLLEHPHFMELTLSPNQPLRLKDIFDRLMALRGSGMPSQYSWSTKRNYKSGYVWHDLALSDIIHPSEGGVEYVLKGSELVEGCSERFQQVNMNEKQTINQEQNFTNYNNNSKRKPRALSVTNCEEKLEHEYEEYEEEEEELIEKDEEKISYTSSTTTPHSRCSRGVSTEELEEEVVVTNNNTVPSVTTIVNSNTTLAEKLKLRDERRVNNGNCNNNYPNRRYNVLLQLIACGGSGSGSEAEAKKQEGGRLSNVGSTSKRREEVVVEKRRDSGGGGCGGGEDVMCGGGSENRRLFGGNVQCEEKEYFSGSIVESMRANRVGFQPEPVLKKSNSYNEERRSRLGMEEVKLKETKEDKREPKGGVREKCIPLKKSPKESRK